MICTYWYEFHVTLNSAPRYINANKFQTATSFTPDPAHLWPAWTGPTLYCCLGSEYLDFDFMVLYNILVLLWGLTITQNSIHTISDLDRSHLTETRSTETASIGAHIYTEYRIDASLPGTELVDGRKSASLYGQPVPVSQGLLHSSDSSSGIPPKL